MKLKTSIRTALFVVWSSLPCAAEDSAFVSMAGDCRYPAVAAGGSTIVLAWQMSEQRNAHITIKRSIDEGKNWSGARKISNDRGDCYPPAIAMHGNTVHLVWMDYGETVDGELYYTRSLDGGETWEKNRILCNNINSARYPLLSCREKNVYLIWQDVENKVYFKASYDQGFTWTDQVLLGKVGKHSCYCYPPAISYRGNELTVVWTDFRDDKRGLNVSFDGLSLTPSRDKTISAVVSRMSEDNGRTWNKAQLISANQLSKDFKEEIDNPIMLSDGTMAYLFWLDRRNLSLGELFFARFDPKTVKYPVAGKNIFPMEKRSPKRPSVVFDKEGNLHFTWSSFFNGESVIYYGQIDPAGTPLKEKKQITSSSGHYYNPIITRCASGQLQIFWFDQPDDKDGWSRIFLKISKDNGATWQDWGPHKKDQ